MIFEFSIFGRHEDMSFWVSSEQEVKLIDTLRDVL